MSVMNMLNPGVRMQQKEQTLTEKREKFLDDLKQVTESHACIY
jgi:hypothetical protein